MVTSNKEISQKVEKLYLEIENAISNDELYFNKKFTFKIPSNILKKKDIESFKNELSSSLNKRFDNVDEKLGVCLYAQELKKILFFKKIEYVVFVYFNNNI